jgi:hypothetical protein
LSKLDKEEDISGTLNGDIGGKLVLLLLFESNSYQDRKFKQNEVMENNVIENHEKFWKLSACDINYFFAIELEISIFCR